MASDVENLSTFYANLPSIFESNLSNSIKSSSNDITTIIDNEKTYQPMFGSFLFADSEPLTRAAFVASIDGKTTEEQQIDENSALKEPLIQTTTSSPLAPTEDLSDMDDDDEDDFDGIPIRHASAMINTKFNNDNHSEDNNLLDEVIHRIENDDDDEEELFLNGFTDEQPQQQNDTITVPSIFKNIPDIDDLNEHEEDDDDRIPFDHMDMLDESDSIRSSSPDSVLSSSHLRYDDDDDEEDEMNNNDDEDDVTQWNDDYLLEKITSQNDRPNAPLPPSTVLNSHPHDQVDFIDSSRSNSRCSNASSHLSIGYADQARIFINDDDGLVTSSDSESDHDDVDKTNYENDILTRDNSEEPSLQVNLDYDRSRSSSCSSYSQNNSTRSSSPIPDQSPIITIDEDINETKENIQSAPIALVDDDDENDHLLTFTSDQPVLSTIPINNFIRLKNDNRQNEIVHDIINMRHMINDYDDDDEFIAVMHNPTVFEEVLYDNDNQQQLDLVEQTNVDISTFQTSSQLSIDNKIESKSIEHYENMQQTSLLSVSNNEEKSPSNITTTNNSSPTAVNHLSIEKQEEEEKENADVLNSSNIKLKTTQQSPEKNTTNINIKQITNKEEEQQDHYQMMSSDDESDNDSELLETLAQLHGLVHTPRSSFEINETETLKTKIQQQHHEEKINHLLPISNIDEKQNIIFSNDDDDKNQKETYERNEEKNSSTVFSSTLLTTSVLFNHDESHSNDTDLDSDASSSVITSNYNSMLSSFDIEVLSIVDKLVSNTLRSALNEINESNQQVEHFVEQILSAAIYEVYNEDKNLIESKLNDNLSTENLVSIIDWHNQTKSSNKQLLDPFDQQFHSVWISHFETPDDIINDHNFDSTSFYSNTLNELNFFSTTSNQANYIQERIPSSFFDSANFTLDKNESSLTTTEQINKESNDLSSTENQDHSEAPSTTIAINENDDTETGNDDNNKPIQGENFFENKAHLPQFEVSGSDDRPLKTSSIDFIANEIDKQFDESSQIQKSSTVTEQQSDFIKSTDDDNEPWELEDNGEERLKPIPTNTTQKHDSYNNFFSDTDTLAPVPIITTKGVEDENENYDNYFSTYQPTENNEPIEIAPSKTVRFSENIQNVAVITPKDSLIQSESSTTTSDTDESEDEHITPTFQTNNNDHINEKEANKDEKTEVALRNTVPRPESIISLTESEDLPPPLPPLPPLNNKRSTSNDNIPSKSSPSSNTDLKRKTNLRSQAENTPINQATTDTRLYSNADSQLLRSHDSVSIDKLDALII